jgi:hypothetical protein
LEKNLVCKSLTEGVEQVVRIHRFGDARRGAHRHRRLDDVAKIRRHENHWQSWPPLMTMAKEVEAIEKRHLQVGDHHIEMALVEDPNGLQAIGNRHCRKIMVLQKFGEQTADVLVIVDHQYALAISAHHVPLSPREQFSFTDSLPPLSSAA